VPPTLLTRPGSAFKFFVISRKTKSFPVTSLHMSLADVFSQISQGIKADPSVLQKVNGSYLFDISSSSGKKSWLVDLKNAPGSVTEASGKADCTITISEADFLAMVSGKLNGQQAFMQGKLKIGGNMGLAMKLESVLKAARSQQGASTSGGASSSSGAVDAKFVFSEITKNLKADPGLVSKVGGTYLFKITTGKGEESWVVDLKNAPGSVKEGSGSADCTITMKEDDFVAMMTGKLNGQQAFMQGKLKIGGNMGLAMKLQQLTAKKAKL